MTTRQGSLSSSSVSYARASTNYEGARAIFPGGEIFLAVNLPLLLLPSPFSSFLFLQTAHRRAASRLGGEGGPKVRTFSPRNRRCLKEKQVISTRMLAIEKCLFYIRRFADSNQRHLLGRNGRSFFMPFPQKTLFDQNFVRSSDIN